MPYPPRTTTVDAGIGRHEKPIRGSIPDRSGLTSDRGYLRPVTEPTGSDASTAAACANPDATSRFTRRSFSSVIGAPYSYRAPALIVRMGKTRQSSVAYASYTVWRKYLSAFPKATELVSGAPIRKSAKSDPVTCPVNPKLPRGSC